MARMISILIAGLLATSAYADGDKAVLVCGTTTYKIDYAAGTIDWGYGPRKITVTSDTVSWQSHNDYTGQDFYFSIDRYSAILTEQVEGSPDTKTQCKAVERQF